MRRATPSIPSAGPGQQAGPWRICLALPQRCLDASVGSTLAIVQTINALRAQEGQAPPIHLTVATAGESPLSTAGGLLAHAAALPSAGGCDQLVVPGLFASSADDIVSWLDQAPQRRLMAAVREHAAAGASVAASCAGTWLLAESGLLDGRSATTVWWLAPQFRQRYPRVKLDVRQLVAVDGNVMTAGAALAHTDLMLGLVARRFGPALAERCARLLTADFRHGQSRHLKIAWLSDADPVMARAQRWIEQHIGDAISVSALAEYLGMTPRTLARRCLRSLGMSPWKLVQRQRAELAVDLLRHSQLPFAKVAAHVGYSDPSALRRLIQREMDGVSGR